MDFFVSNIYKELKKNNIILSTRLFADKCVFIFYILHVNNVLGLRMIHHSIKCDDDEPEH